MRQVTVAPVTDRDSAISGVLDSWVRATRAFAAGGVYPVETGIPGVQLERAAHNMLRELDQRGPHRLGELAEATSLGVSHASRLVEGLVREGLVERTVPTGDRRVTILEVTPGGVRAAEKIEQQFLELITSRLEAFDKSEVIAFATLFQRFAAELIEWSGAEAVGPEPGE